MSEGFSLYLCPPNYPRLLRPGKCSHDPRYQMSAGAKFVQRKIELYSPICMACGKPLPGTSGGNVFTCIVECLGAVGFNIKITTQLRYLSERYLRIARHLFDGDGWTGRHRKWAALIDPNLTMRIWEAGRAPDGTILYSVNADDEYFTYRDQNLPDDPAEAPTGSEQTSPPGGCWSGNQSKARPARERSASAIGDLFA